MRKTVISDDGLVINVVNVAEGSNWTPPVGTFGPDGGQLGQRWNGSAYVRGEVPQEVSPYQARVALRRAGRLADVEALMQDAGTDEEAKLAWKHAVTIRRKSPFIANLGAALGFTEQQIDNLFILASTIE